MVPKNIFPFATVTDGCEEARLIGFFYFIIANELTSGTMYLSMNWANKSQFHFSFIKVDSQNLKFNFKYFTSSLVD